MCNYNINQKYLYVFFSEPNKCLFYFQKLKLNVSKQSYLTEITWLNIEWWHYAKSSKYIGTYIIASRTLSCEIEGKLLIFFFFFCPPSISIGLFESILWITEYKNTLSNHAELTDRGMYFHWSEAHVVTRKKPCPNNNSQTLKSHPRFNSKCSTIRIQKTHLIKISIFLGFTISGFYTFLIHSKTITFLVISNARNP